MKKILVTVFLVLTTLLLSGCASFNSSETYDLPATNPQVTTVYAMLKPNTEFNASLFQELIAKINTMPQGETKITKALFKDADKEKSGDNALYELKLTLENAPAQAITIDTDLFFKTRYHSVFNPISLLPVTEDDPFVFYLGIPSTRRHSQTTADLVQQNTAGNYIYFWNTNNDIIFTDIFPNRTIYYVIALLAATAVGFAVYFICKKHKKKI